MEARSLQTKQVSNCLPLLARTWTQVRSLDLLLRAAREPIRRLLPGFHVQRKYMFSRGFYM